MASATMSSSSTIRSRTRHSRANVDGKPRGARRVLGIADGVIIRIDGLASIQPDAAAPGRDQRAQLRLIGFREGLGEQVRKSVRGALRQAREHFAIEFPILRLVLRSEHAAL